jgi:hypothetical protein
MSHVYIVVATRDSEIENCEAFAGVQSALGRAFQLASDKSGRGRTDLFNPSPSEESMSDGSVRWVFMNTNKQSVTVTFRKIEDSLLSSKDPLSAVPPHSAIVGGSQNIAVVPSAWVQPIVSSSPIHKRPYDFMDRSLPAGWTVEGKPTLMGDMLDNPNDTEDPANLSEDQKWALVTVRVKKSPLYHSAPINGYTYFHEEALDQLDEQSMVGEQIRDSEILSLHSLWDDLVSGVLRVV